MEQMNTIQEAEERLRLAMLAGDVSVLDELLADELQAVGPDGRMMGKADDLAAHRASTVRFTTLMPLDTTTQQLPDVAIVFVRMAVTGFFREEPFAGHYRYTRVWRWQTKSWQVVAAHISPVPES